MVKEDRTCDQKCEGCEFEKDKRCIDVLVYTLKVKVVVIEKPILKGRWN